MKPILVRIAAWLGLLPVCHTEGPLIPPWADQAIVQRTARDYYYNRCEACRFRESCLFASLEEERMQDERDMEVED